MQHVFVYGTLLFTEILEGLTGRSFSTQNAALKKFKRLRVAEGDYPAIIEAREEVVQGSLVFNVDARSMEVLRFYEGDDYECRKLEVTVNDKSIMAWVFVWNEDMALLSNADWNKDYFKRKFLADYLKYVVPETVSEFTKLYS